VIFRKQYYLRALLQPPFTFFRHADEQFAAGKGFEPGPDDLVMTVVDGGWEFPVKGSGFEAVFRIEIDNVPDEGEPSPLHSAE
jgi:hypothetical protein